MVTVPRKMVGLERMLNYSGPSIPDTLGPEGIVLIIEASSLQRLDIGLGGYQNTKCL